MDLDVKVAKMYNGATDIEHKAETCGGLGERGLSSLFYIYVYLFNNDLHD